MYATLLNAEWFIRMTLNGEVISCLLSTGKVKGSYVNAFLVVQCKFTIRGILTHVYTLLECNIHSYFTREFSRNLVSSAAEPWEKLPYYWTEMSQRNADWCLIVPMELLQIEMLWSPNTATVIRLILIRDRRPNRDSFITRRHSVFELYFQITRPFRDSVKNSIVIEDEHLLTLRWHSKSFLGLSSKSYHPTQLKGKKNIFQCLA